MVPDQHCETSEAYVLFRLLQTKKSLASKDGNVHSSDTYNNIQPQSELIRETHQYKTSFSRVKVIMNVVAPKTS